jgi:arylsulfatase A-like enzyme
MQESIAGRIHPTGRYLAAGLALGYAAGVAEGALVNRAGIAFVPFAALCYGILFGAGFLLLAAVARLIRRDLVALGLGLAVMLFVGLEAGFLFYARANPFEESGPALARSLAVIALALALGVVTYLVARCRQVGRTAGRVASWLFPITIVGLAGFFLLTWRVPKPGDNCILISVDAMRADHTGLYGYHRETTPTLDALARNSTMWLKAYTQSPGTSGGHGAMLSGLYPISNGAYLNGFPLDSKVETLAEVFAESGYATAAFINNWYLSPALGFGQGFDCFVDGGKAVILKDAHPAIFLRGLVLYQVIHRGLVPPGAPSDAEVVDAFRWMAWRRNHRFFILLHIMDPHSPYVAPNDLRGHFGPAGETLDPAYIEGLHQKSLTQRLTPAEQQFLTDRYDEEILSADRKIGRIFEQLDRLGLREKTLVVVTADHGEVLEESTVKQFGHGTLDYGCLRVPLLMSCPGIAPGGWIVQTVTETLDITPTIIHLMNLKDTARRQGRSLLEPAGARAGARANGSPEGVAFTTGDLATRDEYSVVTDDWQYLILGDKVALCSPGNTADLISLYPGVADSLQTVFEAWLARCRADAVVPFSLKDRSVRPGKEALDRLKAVGYIH